MRPFLAYIPFGRLMCSNGKPANSRIFSCWWVQAGHSNGCKLSHSHNRCLWRQCLIPGNPLLRIRLYTGEKHEKRRLSLRFASGFQDFDDGWPFSMALSKWKMRQWFVEYCVTPLCIIISVTSSSNRSTTNPLIDYPSPFFCHPPTPSPSLENTHKLMILILTPGCLADALKLSSSSRYWAGYV